MEFAATLPAVVSALLEGAGGSAPQLHDASLQQRQLQRQRQPQPQPQPQRPQRPQRPQPVHSLEPDMAVRVVREDEEQLAVEVLPEASDSEEAQEDAAARQQVTDHEDLVRALRRLDEAGSFGSFGGVSSMHSLAGQLQYSGQQLDVLANFDERPAETNRRSMLKATQPEPAGESSSAAVAQAGDRGGGGSASGAPPSRHDALRAQATGERAFDKLLEGLGELEPSSSLIGSLQVSAAREIIVLHVHECIASVQDADTCTCILLSMPCPCP